jgi:hypothetical protein
VFEKSQRLAEKHQPVQYEFLFVLGFSGERSRYSPLLGTLFSGGTPYLMQECLTPPICTPDLRFSIPYKPDRTVSMSPKGHGLPRPDGFSGSAVWNTRFRECILTGKTWSPLISDVTGIVWGWNSRDRCLLATRIEHVRRFMLSALRQEAA